MIKELEAILFCAEAPLSVADLSIILNCTEGDVIGAIDELNSKLESADSALIVREVSSGWALFTRPEVSSVVEAYIAETETKSLSPSSLETLAIVAYTQPVTRAKVSDIRGVNSDALISSLVKKGYICVVGVDEQNNNAATFGTTSTFLDRYGLKSIDELPELADFAPDDETRLAIVERLSQSFTTDSEL